MHGQGDTDPITLGSFLVQNNAGIVAGIDVNAGQMALDGTISAGSGHGLRVGDTLILDVKNLAETTTGLATASLSDTNSGTKNGTLYYLNQLMRKQVLLSLPQDQLQDQRDTHSRWSRNRK